MKRGPQKWTETVISQFEAEGRGTGELSAYRPWLTIGDVPSRGRVRQAFSSKTGRTHHLLSDNEWHAFLMLERAVDTEDIREQYPLQRDLTQEIALSLGIRHPAYPGTRVPAVMTLDFLVTRIRNGQRTLVALDSKSDEELDNPRAMEKLEISREVCQALGIPHHLLLTSLVPATKVKNLEWIRGGALREHEIEPREGFYEEHMTTLLHDIVTYPLEVSLREFCKRYDARAGVSPGTALRCSRMLMHSRALSVDLFCEDIPSTRIGAFQATAEKGHLRQVWGAA